MKTREEVEAETRAVNAFRKKPVYSVCELCNNTGRLLAPLFGDPGLGYCDAGPCWACTPKPPPRNF